MRTRPIVVLSSGALVAAALAFIGFYSSCGSTGGGNDAAAETSQFVSQSCAPAGGNGGGSCLSLQTPNSVPADGSTVSGFRARLVDGSGAPITGAQICFAFENPGVATLVEPTNGCGLTDQNGTISGQFRDGTNTGSFALVATPQAGFALQIRRTISFVGVGGGTVGGGGGSCALGDQCPSGECSSNGAICPLGSCCLSAAGDPCTSSSSCASNLTCNNGTCSTPATPVPAATSTPAGPVPTPTPAQVDGTTCTANLQCASGCCCATPVAPFTANTCLEFPSQCTTCL